MRLYSGTTVSDSVLETAADELVLTGQLSEDLDSEKISDLIAYLKQQIAENHLMTRTSWQTWCVRQLRRWELL